jgi:hypothetical protein
MLRAQRTIQRILTSAVGVRFALRGDRVALQSLTVLAAQESAVPLAVCQREIERASRELASIIRSEERGSETVVVSSALLARLRAAGAVLEVARTICVHRRDIAGSFDDVVAIVLEVLRQSSA